MKNHASLNRLFHLLWSQVQHGWVPVSEAAKGATRGRHRALITLPLFILAATAQGGPDGGQVISGAGTIAQSGATTTINQSSQDLSLTWQSFNVGAQETVNFEQPSASAIAVNRIFDTNGSQILGQLNANGQVFLINPNGVLFGQSAQVSVGGLIASTLDIEDASGDVKHFSGQGTGSVTNHGEVTAADGGYVALLGNRVSNQGSINAPLGIVALGAGTAITLTFQSNSLLSMQVDESILNSAADNGGLIRADGGMVVMNAGAKDALLASVVNNTGVIEARTVEHRNGSIVLLGGMEAGTVNVAGTLDASAPDGGDGGFIDTSAAHVKIADDVSITTAATSGRTGTWLIDPVDFTIAASEGDITGSTLSNSLGNTDVIIESVNGGTGTLGDVNVNDVVTWSANRLTLNAENNINVNANMNASGSASLALEFGQTAVAAGNNSDVVFNGAAINLAAGTTNFTTRQGSDGLAQAYTVITSLGAEGSTTAADLQGMAGDVTLNYVLGSNIDASATSGWNTGAGFMPIGTPSAFSGTFDGLGHTVSNLFINRPGTNGVGLFGYMQNAQIHNVGLVDVAITGNDQVGGLIGSSVVGSASGIYVTGQVSGRNRVGGLIGYGNTTPLRFSYTTTNVTGASSVGGLIGETNGGSPTSFNFATGNVTGSGSNVGGLVGFNGFAHILSDSYATGAVTGGDAVGGLVGFSLNGAVRRTYATGTVSGTTNVGGLVGSNGGEISSSFWDTVTSLQATSAGGTGLNSEQMQQQSSFAGWNFSNTWIGYDGFTNPLLRSFMSELTVTLNDVTTTYNGFANSGGNGVTYSTSPDGNLLGTLIYSGSSQGATNAGTDYLIEGSGLYSNQLGYIINYVDGTLTIDQADITLSTSDVTRTYDAGLNAEGSLILTGGTMFGSDTVSGGTFAFTDKNIGDGNKIVTTSDVTVNDGNSGNNYNVSYATNTTSTITAAELFVTGVSASSRNYDGTLLAALHGTATVAALGSDIVSVDANGSGVFTDRHVGTNKEVTVSGYNLTGTDAGNYLILQPTGLTADISAANLTLSTTDVSKIYDAGLSAAGSVIITNGTIFGSDSLSGGTFSFTDKNIGDGNKIVTTSDVTVNDGNSGDNYNLSYANNTTSTITAASLAVTGVTADDKRYDGTTTARLIGAPTVAAFASDSVAVTGTGLAEFSDPGIGSDKSVTVSGYTLGGADASNYLLVQPSGLTADITAAFIPLPVSRIASQITSLLSLPPTSTQQLPDNSFSIRSTIPAEGNDPDSVMATDGTVRPSQPGSTVRVVNGGVSLPDNWNVQ